MTERRTARHIEHMITAADRTARHLSGVTREDFEASELTQDAVITTLAVIGEAARVILETDPDFTAAHNDIPWRQIRGMRNRLVHEYFAIDVSAVWMQRRNYSQACAPSFRTFSTP